MNDCDNCPFRAECGMRRESGADQQVVYYRGRFWVDAAWSKVGTGAAGACPAMVKVEGSCPDEAAAFCRKAGGRAWWVELAPGRVQTRVQQNDPGAACSQNRD